MSSNMELYNSWRAVPDTAIKPISAGRLKGMSDINPMWRMERLTETFGPCGIGWKYVIRREWLETGAGGEISAFVDIDLYYKWEGQWSEAVPGTGGSSFVAKEKAGLYTSDECFKKALTDAISVACKALGIGADVYWKQGRTKYSEERPAPQQKPQNQPRPQEQRKQQDGNLSAGKTLNRCIKVLKQIWNLETNEETIDRLNQYNHNLKIRKGMTEEEAEAAVKVLTKWIDEYKAQEAAV